MPSWQSLLKALLLASLVSSALDLAIHYWRTPLGWTPQALARFYLATALTWLLLASVVGLLIGLPLARFAARKGRFRAVNAAAVGAILGFLSEIALSALGNTYRFMSGIGFWQSFWIAGFGAALAGYLWWRLETGRITDRNA
jgi:hypothetical protein